ncbi:MAG: PTS system mannose/fructose/sorbose family transporter subunit IID [Gemmatimonadota bacterium]
MRPLRTDFVSAWLRGFAVQGSWNYRTLLGGGIAYSLLPLLRRVYAGDPVGLKTAVRRHLESFNAHPYLCPMAVGALARLEAEGEEAEKIERFRIAIRGPLGTLGDRLVWATWRPVCLFVAILLFAAGATPWVAALAFLGLYNSGHAALRIWGMRTGWLRGLRLGRALHDSWLDRVATALAPLNLLLLGAATLALSLRIPHVADAGIPLAIGGASAALVAFRWPARGGKIAIGLLLAAPLVWLTLG